MRAPAATRYATAMDEATRSLRNDADLSGVIRGPRFEQGEVRREIFGHRLVSEALLDEAVARAIHDGYVDAALALAAANRACGPATLERLWQLGDEELQLKCLAEAEEKRRAWVIEKVDALTPDMEGLCGQLGHTWGHDPGVMARVVQSRPLLLKTVSVAVAENVVPAVAELVARGVHDVPDAHRLLTSTLLAECSLACAIEVLDHENIKVSAKAVTATLERCGQAVGELEAYASVERLTALLPKTWQKLRKGAAIVVHPMGLHPACPDSLLETIFEYAATSVQQAMEKSEKRTTEREDGLRTWMRAAVDLAASVDVTERPLTREAMSRCEVPAIFAAVLGNPTISLDDLLTRAKEATGGLGGHSSTGSRTTSGRRTG